MFMTTWFFLILASRNLMVRVLTQLHNVPFFFLYTTQESKKRNKFEKIASASSNHVIVELIIFFKSIKSLHTKSTSSIDVQD
jgi:hypothetical protein